MPDSAPSVLTGTGSLPEGSTGTLAQPETKSNPDLSRNVSIWANSSHRVMLILMIGLVGLIGYRWFQDHRGTRPTKLQRNSVGISYQIDLNRASKSELMQLPGIGPQMAEHILSYRSINGPFPTVDHLKNVRGIGDATLNRVKPWIRIDPPEEEEPSSELEPLILTRKPTFQKSEKPITHTTLKPNQTLFININTDPTSELERLPGIGPAFAQRIIEERSKKPFAKIEDLRRVKGIGEKRFEQLKLFITVGE
jgi:competence protein ComEA